jgi:hypothetical protein
MSKYSIYAKLGMIQQELKAPKNLNNSFGKYNYRSNESILEALKPLLLKYECTLIQGDELVHNGDRFHIASTSRLICIESGTHVECTGYAREALTKKGMDDSQITGACSSYARKYSLNGLFLIDDNKDADTNSYQRQQTAAPQSQKQSDEAWDLFNSVKDGMSKDGANYCAELLKKRQFKEAIDYINGGK